LPPVEFCLGTSPSHAANSLPLPNMLGSATVAAIAVAMIGPIPGMVARRWLTRFLLLFSVCLLGCALQGGATVDGAGPIPSRCFQTASPRLEGDFYRRRDTRRLCSKLNRRRLITRRRPSLVPFGLARARPALPPLANSAPLELSSDTQHLKHRVAGGVQSIHPNATPFRMDADVTRLSVRRARAVECDWPSLPGVGTAPFEGLGNAGLSPTGIPLGEPMRRGFFSTAPASLLPTTPRQWWPPPACSGETKSSIFGPLLTCRSSTTQAKLEA
jgi:hypothetical protein